MTRSLYCYRDICPCDLDHLWNGYNRGWWGWFFLSFSLFSSVFLRMYILFLGFFVCFLNLFLYFPVLLSFEYRVYPFCSFYLSLTHTTYRYRFFCFTHRYVKSMVREKLLDDMSQLTKVYLFIFVVRKLIND